MENYFDMLPKEIVDKIMWYISHPVSDIMKNNIIQYNAYVTNFDFDRSLLYSVPVSFYYYTLHCIKIDKEYKQDSRLGLALKKYIINNHVITLHRQGVAY